MIRFAKPAALSLVLTVTAALPSFASVDIAEVETPGGLTAWLVEEPTIPFVALEIVFKGGTSLDAPEKLGAVNLMTALIEEGAGDLDARAFAAARDDLAASFRFSASDDSVSVSARFLVDTTDEAMDLLHSALTEPRFDADAVERVRAQVLSGLRSDAEDPNAIAGRTFAEAVFGDHPYARAGDGTPDTVAALTRDDLMAAFKGAIARDRVTIAAAGDISPEALSSLLDSLLADLPETGTALPGPATISFDGSTTVIDFPTPQSVISFGQPGIARDDDDFFAAYVLNQILGGGGFGSRLTEEVRVKRGLTYGIYSYLANKDLADLYVGGASTANARAAETIEVVRAEWARMAEEGPTQAELDAAKTYLIGGYPLRFDSNASIANILVGMQLDDLTPEYLETRNDRVAAVTLDDVKRVAAELLDPDELTFIVVGQPEGLAPGN
ncbi:M16 family metallopeptidase [Meridianimarinicoccus aquatilis]|uniref:Insulinase family protein n=1 Tax=Meridianimarinicoccus aquatilis TaxID=2552766 RepID=A0A4V3BB09_9RHOB|nr:pitrilysin family protein [Fluviibacterium aquatile]TDL85319.1 insulinase family protein [Fluviibacterium aquatile]